MTHEHQVDVLIAGAGPVGLLTANLLAEQGLAVELVDHEGKTAARNYACALHASALQLLERLGLLETALKSGRRIQTMSFYDGSQRRAELDLRRLPGRFPFVLVLPQSDLEQMLEKRLAAFTSAQVHWNHRLMNVRPEGDTVLATIDRLGETSKGYMVPTWQWTVEKTLHTRARFVVGADGCRSTLRRLLGIDSEQCAPPQAFAVFECDLEHEAGDEVRVVLGETLNAFWPLPGNQCRWSLESRDPHDWSGLPPKDRNAWRLLDPIADAQTRYQLTALIQQRAPWFTETIVDIEWSPHVEFEPRLARSFGQDRCWLVGDAAHQTGPIGAQSMNVGLGEAELLAAKITAVLRENAPPNSLDAFNQQCQSQWRTLLGMTGGLRPGPHTDPWLKEQAARILPCLPATGADLAALAAQWGFELE